MKIIFLLSIIILLRVSCFAQQENTELKPYPFEMKDHKLYLEKFAPKHQHDLVDFNKFNIDDEDKFIELLRLYNDHLYRSINNSNAKTIASLEAEENIVPMYLRDFEESPDSSIRFIIKNDFSILDVFEDAASKKYSYSYGSTGRSFHYYIYDRATNTSYMKYDDLELLLRTADVLYDYMEKKPTATEEEFNKKSSRLISKNTKGETSRALKWAMYIAMYGGFYAGIIILANMF